MGSERRVMRRVFEGGDGVVRGGRVVRSSDKGLRERFFDNEEGGEPVSGGESDGLVLMGEGVCCSFWEAMVAVAVVRRGCKDNVVLLETGSYISIVGSGDSGTGRSGGCGR